MLHPVYRLAISAGRAPVLEPFGAKSWQRRLLVPRSMCVFESLPCAGLSLHEYRSFARLQAARLSPWLKTGASAAIRNGRLMLWFWDQEELNALLAQSGAQKSDLHPIVETLYRPMAWHSDREMLQCDGGVEQLRFEDGALISSQWQPGTGAATGPWRGSPWAFELLGSGKSERQPLAFSGFAAAAMRFAPAALLTGAAAYALFHAGNYLGLDHHLQALEGEAEQADQRISSLSAVGQELKKETQWLGSYRQRAASVDLQNLMDVLRPVLERNGVVLKEFELRNDQLRIAVVAVGGDIDLPELLRSLSHMAGAGDVQLRDNAELRQATFTVQVSGMRRLLGPGA